MTTRSTTLRDGIDALVKFHALLVDAPLWQLVEDSTTATLRYEVPAGSLRCRRFSAELTMAGFFRMVRHFARDARPRVLFEHAAPSYRAEYARIFDGLARFEQPFTGIVMDRRLMDSVQLHKDVDFHESLKAQAEKRLTHLAQNRTYADRVREYLLERATPDRRDMQGAARALGISARSLRRRLFQEGCSYSAIADDALATLAKRLLSDQERSIQATAYTMGFADPSAFYRAFKRWTGTTPKEYRARKTSAERGAS
jgi:AraC-like DNA-binding protein